MAEITFDEPSYKRIPEDIPAGYEESWTPVLTGLAKTVKIWKHQDKDARGNTLQDRLDAAMAASITRGHEEDRHDILGIEQPSVAELV